jgi:hypothetical protein
MQSDSTASVDLTKELRLRRWARQNYVSAEERCFDWHAIVLDEMKRRDAELSVEQDQRARAGRFVPLPPTDLRRLDEAHDAVGQPNMLNADTRTPNDVVQDSWS